MKSVLQLRQKSNLFTGEGGGRHVSAPSKVNLFTGEGEERLHVPKFFCCADTSFSATRKQLVLRTQTGLLCGEEVPATR